MSLVVGIIGGDASEQVLEGLAGHEVAVAERRLAEFGQERVAGPVDPNLAMAFKLMMSAHKKWRKLDGRNRLPEIIQGIKFRDGIRQLHIAA